ncbi:hypothetical protein GCM10009069_16480 [Algimonas arctica]|uniref:Copper resistance protein B n=1 Tax=Algimonas arctica TaxID=1479486 RepID=A0A8J3G2J3_9PROT|nr:copper resistance protein B [Algimonas arctica]GHA94058.1 hypothetical protein GCM10009069_16480 [Algimonas arctica]
MSVLSVRGVAFTILGVSALVAPLSAHAQNADAAEPDKLWSMADRYWGEAVMAEARDDLLAENGDMKTSMLMFDRLEWQDTGGDGTLLWDFQGWYGGDINKLYIKSEGEVSLEDDEIEDAEVQALWSRAVAPFWDVQAGIRYDLEPKGRTHAVLGIQGLAPYWFEVDTAAFLSTDGDLSARIEAEYDLRFSQRLVLQPRIEANLSAQDIRDIGVGAGLSSIEPGVRLRYEIRRTFAPYIGVEWQKQFGNTADFTRADGGDADNIVGVIGLRTWF